jgi:uncharacterized protein
MQLSITERLILCNQYRILEKIFPNESETCTQFQNILKNGYQLHYCEIFQSINEEPMTRDQSKEVLDIMSMYQEMQDLYNKIPDKSCIDLDQLTFPGFDGCNESNLLEYARYCIEDLGQYNRLRIIYLNSHHPTIDMYRRMLDEWREVQYCARKEDIIRILAAC